MNHGRSPFDRLTEATTEQLVATGAGVGYVDGEPGWRSVSGSGPREVPAWTRERALRSSIAGYRANPMAKAIIDTYTSFCVGDSGLTVQSSDPATDAVLQEFWNDPRNALKSGQELMFRSHLIMGESLYELLVGETTGVVRRNPIDPLRIRSVSLLAGNPLWPDVVTVSANQNSFEGIPLSVVQPDDLTGLRTGDAIFWPSFKALETDVRGYPFLAPVLDWIDNYDQVMSNLVDRTALLRYLALDVELEGASDTDIEDFIRKRGGTHAPRSGQIEVHNEKVKWKPVTSSPGSYEDSNTSKNLLTSVAAGTGLSKPWLAEPGDSNRGTSMSMSEPVRRRVGGVQNRWLECMVDLFSFAVDQSVIAGRLPSMVTLQSGVTVPTSSTITVSGPEIAAADAKITAQVLNQLATSIEKLTRTVDPVTGKPVMSHEAARIAIRKAWEDFVGVPYRPELDGPDVDVDDIATAVDDAGAASSQIAAVAA